MRIQRVVEKTDETVQQNNQQLFQHLADGTEESRKSDTGAESSIQFLPVRGFVLQQSPSIVNFRFAPVEGEVMLHHLEKKRIYVGLGSACSAHSKEPSKILTGIGLSPEEARCSLRISFGPQNTLADVDAFLEAFGEAYRQLFSTFNRKTAHK